MTSAATIILVLYLIQGSLGHSPPQSPIVGAAGAHAVNIEDAPFIAGLLHVNDYDYIDDRHLYCGGTIIHKQFVLTSASCTELQDIIVMVGSSQDDEESKLHQVEKKIRHESSDVGLIKLSEPVTLGPTVALIKLADDTVNIPVGLTANVTGWGYTHGLKQASVIVSSKDVCNNQYRFKITNQQICVDNRAEGVCYLDGGNPLIAGDLQIGIYLYGHTCAGSMERPLEPKVYGKVAPYLQWIHDKIEENL